MTTAIVDTDVRDAATTEGVTDDDARRLYDNAFVGSMSIGGGTLAEVLGRSSPSLSVKSVHKVHEDCCSSLFQNKIKLDPFFATCKQ